MPRRHDIDALRAIAFALLILYHVGMLYVHDWGWHIKSTYQYEWLQWPMLFVNRWRMDLIFLISGVASAFLLKPGKQLGFLGSRSRRLLLPLLFGIVVIVPIQPYVQGVTNGAVHPGFVNFLLDYFSGKRWPENAFDGWATGFTWNHLWYLAYLWPYTLALTALASALGSRLGQRLQSALTGLVGARLLILPALPLLAWTVLLQARFPDNGDFIHDWYRNAMYFTVFLYGFMIARSASFWSEALRLRRPALAVALSLGGAYLALVAAAPDDVGELHQLLIWTVRNLYVWITLMAILGWSHALLNRPFPWLRWANEAVFPWYVLHQSLIVLAAYWLVPARLGVMTEASLVLLFTIAGCYGVTAVARCMHWLRPWLGMKTVTTGTIGTNCAIPT